MAHLRGNENWRSSSCTPLPFNRVNSHEGDILLVTKLQATTSTTMYRVHANVCAALTTTILQDPDKCMCCPPPSTTQGSRQMVVLPSTIHQSSFTSHQFLQSTAHPMSPSGSLCVALPVTKVTNHLILKLIKLSCNLVNHTLIHSSNNPHPKSTSYPSCFHQGWLSGWSSWLALDHPHLC